MLQENPGKEMMKNGVVKERENVSLVKNNQIRKISIIDKMAADEAERAAHRAEQDEKDRQFSEFLKGLEKQTSKVSHSVRKTKITLSKEVKEKERMAEKRRVVKQENIRLEMAGTETMMQRLSETYRRLELNSAAHSLDEWCPHCECIHIADVVKEESESEM